MVHRLISFRHDPILRQTALVWSGLVWSNQSDLDSSRFPCCALATCLHADYHRPWWKSWLRFVLDSCLALHVFESTAQLMSAAAAAVTQRTRYCLRCVSGVPFPVLSFGLPSITEIHPIVFVRDNYRVGLGSQEVAISWPATPRGQCCCSSPGSIS